MSREQIGLFGEAEIDIWNNPRTAAYVRAFSQQSYKLLSTCDVDISAYVSEELSTFTNPEADGAWWIDPAVTASYSFLGLMVTKINGLSDNVLEIKDVPIPSHASLSYSPPVNKGFTITVEGVLWGLSCCGVEYGFRRLRKELAAFQGVNACQGTSLRMLSCVPGAIVSAGNWTPPAITDDPWRTVFNVKLVEQPSIVSGSGVSCGCGCQPLTRIIFTLRSNGELYSDSEGFSSAQALRLGDAEITDPALSCYTGNGIVGDPVAMAFRSSGLLTAPLQPIGGFGTLFTWHSGFAITAKSFVTDIEMFIYAGSSDLHNVRVRVQALSGVLVFGFAIETLAAYTTWSRTTANGVGITIGGVWYAAPESILTLDGLPGNPLMRLPGDSQVYTVFVESDQFSTAIDATITVGGRKIAP